MDLGLKGRKAIICASSRGLGKACAISLAQEGCAVYINGLTLERLNQAADEIRAKTGVSVTAVQADINTEEGRAKLVAACPDADILVNNNAGPTPGSLQDWGHKEWMYALEANMLAGIFMIKALIPGMRERKYGRVVNILSAMVKSPSASQGLSTAARTGLAALCKSVSREAAPDNVTLNNLLPQRIDTDRQRFMCDRLMKKENITAAQARAKLEATVAAKRFGRPEEFGDACAFLCSAQAGFISGQMLQLDGGSYHGLV